MKNKTYKKLIVGILVVQILIIIFLKLTSISIQKDFIISILKLFFYTGIAILIWIEREDLSTHNIDKLSLLLIIISGSILRLFTSSESSIAIIIDVVLFSGVSLFLIFKFREIYKNLSSIRVKDILWIIFAFITGSILSLLLSYPEFITSGAISIDHKMNTPSLIIYFLIYFSLNLSNASLLEEPLYRGFFWGYFAKKGISSRTILLLTTFLFWVSHINYFDHPYTFLIKVPIFGLFLGLLVWRSGSLSTSFVAHASINATTILSFDIIRLLMI